MKCKLLLNTFIFNNILVLVMKKWILFSVCFPYICLGQSLFKNENTFLREGNNAYKKSEYLIAEENYRQSLAKNAQNEKAKFNLADALYAQKRYNEAAKEYNELASVTQNTQLQSQCYYNGGNALMEMNKYKEAIEAYKNALRRNPADADAKYNLAYAQKKLQQQQQQNQQKKDKEQKQEEKKAREKDQKTQNEEKKQQEEQEKRQEEEQKSQDKQQSNKGNNTAQPSLRKEDAERILDALKTEEEKVKQRQQQQKVQLKTHKSNTSKDW